MPPLVIQKRLRPESIRALKTAIPYIVEQAKALTRLRLKRLAEIYTPVRTGNLLRSFDGAFTPRHIIMKWDAKNTFGESYAEAVEIGADPHTIRAKRWPTLVFFYQGRWRRPKEVQHKGFPGRFYGEALGFEAADIFQRYLATLIEAWEG